MSDPLQAFADPTRLSILKLICQEEFPAGQIAKAFPHITRPAVSQHLRVLKEAGLVWERREGTKRLYRVRRKGLFAIYQELEACWGEEISLHDIAQGQKNSAPLTSPSSSAQTTSQEKDVA